MEALNLSVRLRVVRADMDMGCPCDAGELLEILGDELGSVVRDDAWLRVWEALTGALRDELRNLGLLGQMTNEVNDFVPDVVRNPAAS